MRDEFRGCMFCMQARKTCIRHGLSTGSVISRQVVVELNAVGMVAEESNRLEPRATGLGLRLID